jgi:hypothetical protein
MERGIASTCPPATALCRSGSLSSCRFIQTERAGVSVQNGRFSDKVLFSEPSAAAFQLARGFDFQGNALQLYAFGQEKLGCPFPASYFLPRCRSIALLSSLIGKSREPEEQPKKRRSKDLHSENREGLAEVPNSSRT